IGARLMKSELGAALTEPMNPELNSILKHRFAGHGISFRPSEATASIDCQHCEMTIISGIRHEIEILYECLVQFPANRKNKRRGGNGLKGNAVSDDFAFHHLLDLARALRLAQRGNLARGIKPDADDARRLEAALDYFISEHDGKVRQ